MTLRFAKTGTEKLAGRTQKGNRQKRFGTMSDTEKSPLEFKPLGKRGINLTGESPIAADPLPEADDLAELLEDDDARLTPDMLADSAAEAPASDTGITFTPATDSEDDSSADGDRTEEAAVLDTAPAEKIEAVDDVTEEERAEDYDYAIDSLGGSLRHAREKTGYDIPDIADHLRIRKAHLQALENETWDELPGTVYIIGYLRSYGDFLGLDPQALIDRYKSGDHGPVAANDLSFPSPQKESRMPKWPLIAATLVCGAVGYWFWSDWNADKAPAETVMAAPGMEEQVEQTVVPAEPAQEAAPETINTNIPAAAIEAAESGAISGTDNAAPAVAEATVEPAAEEIVTATEEATEAVAAAIGEESASATETETSPATPVDNATVTSAAEEATAPAIEETETVVAAVTEEHASTPTPSIGVSEANAAPSESGPVGGDSRITLIGRHDAWIQIKDGEGEVLAARLLRKDESYHVPNLDGLKLVTGNAGGLEVAVDGRPGKSLGPIGGVLRDLELDPDSLKAE